MYFELCVFVLEGVVVLFEVLAVLLDVLDVADALVELGPAHEEYLAVVVGGELVEGGLEVFALGSHEGSGGVERPFEFVSH